MREDIIKVNQDVIKLLTELNQELASSKLRSFSEEVEDMFIFLYAGPILEQAARHLSTFVKLKQRDIHKDNLKRKRIPQTKRTAVFERDKYRCVKCKSFSRLAVDHIKPVNKGGTDDIANLQTLCKSCNSSKGIKHPLKS